MRLLHSAPLSNKHAAVRQTGFLDSNNTPWLLLAYAIILLLFIYLLAPQPSMDKLNTAASTSSPLLLRISSGPFHTLLADQHWLLSARLDESVQPNQSSEQSQIYFNQMASIIELDPGFMPGLRYAATYLASIYREVDLAHDLLDIAIRYYPENVDLRVFKIAQEVSYQYPPRLNKIKQWTQALQLITDEFPDWLGGASMYALKREKQRELQKEDLHWLLKNASTDIEKKAILKRLDVLAAE